MKLQSLKSSNFEALSESKMSKIKGGEMIATNARNTQTGAPVNDRQEVTVIRDKNGNVVGEKLGCIEYQFNGVWHSPIAH